MAAHVSSAPEQPATLDSGKPQPSGTEEVLLDSLAAVKAVVDILQACFGPHGRRKLLVTAQGETLCTSHSTAILSALELGHPAARLLREAAFTQAEENGDGTAFVVLLAGALMEQVVVMLRTGLALADLRESLAAATGRALRLLPGLATLSIDPLEDPARALRAVVDTHTPSHSDYLAGLAGRACSAARGLDGSFDPQRVAICLVPGAKLGDSCLLPGLAVGGVPCGQVTMVTGGAKVALFTCSFTLTSPRPSAIPHFSSPDDLPWSPEEKVKDKAPVLLDQLADAGINVAVIGSSTDKESLELADRHGMLLVRVRFRKEMIRLGQVLGTTLQSDLTPPAVPGTCRRVCAQELREGSTVVFEWEGGRPPALTLVLRDATSEGLQEAEQAVRHAIGVYGQLCQDARLLPGAGAVEMALAKELLSLGNQLVGPERPGILAFAQALQAVPSVLAENADLPVAETMAQLQSLHQAGDRLAGVGDEGIVDVAAVQVWDSLRVKIRGLELAADVALGLSTEDEIGIFRRQGSLPEVDQP